MLTIALTLSFYLLSSVALVDTASPSEEDFESLRKKIGYHRNAAIAWTRMTYFDVARQELAEADRISSALRALQSHAGAPSPSPAEQLWDLQNELEVVHLRARAHSLMLEKFNLPKDTLSFIEAAPYERMAEPHWYVIYTVPPGNLTEEKITEDPLSFLVGAHIPGSRSYIATYKALEEGGEGKEVTFIRSALTKVPDGHTPTYVRLNYGGDLLVLTESADQAGDMRFYPDGGMLLHHGKPVIFLEGPFAGPAIIPRQDEGRFDAMMTSGGMTSLYLLRYEKDGALLAIYGSPHWRCKTQVHFAGSDIVDITKRKTVLEETVWESILHSGAKRTRDEIQHFASIYNIRHELASRRIVSHGHSSLEPEIDFDGEKRHWRVTYRWGRMEIAGGVRTIIIDDRGRLVDIQETIVRL